MKLLHEEKIQQEKETNEYRQTMTIVIDKLKAEQGELVKENEELGR